MKQKVIVDAVHGAINLNSIEAKIINTSIFQRLHNVRQLGLAHHVFPGAAYSRFSHSVGACHNAGLILDAIYQNSQTSSGSDYDEVKKYIRLAALFHDIGHYPYSHATEHLVDKYYGIKNANSITENSPIAISLAESSIENNDLPVVGYQNREKRETHFNHEKLGEILIENDQELQEIFVENNIDVNVLKRIFNKTVDLDYSKYRGIISSDLDCDRLDYLARTAHFSGSAFGVIDAKYIISCARIYDNKYCFDFRALRAADHLLLSRYFDYMQIPFQKTVTALEWSLISCMEDLLKREMLDLSSSGIRNRIAERTWSDVDDQYVFSKIRELKKNYTKNTVIYDHIDALTRRRVPKLIWSSEGFYTHSDNQNALIEFEKNKTNLEILMKKLSEKLGMDPDRFYLWSHKMKFHKITKSGEDENEDIIHFYREKSGEADLVKITECRNSVVRNLKDKLYYGFKIFYIPRTSIKEFEMDYHIKAVKKEADSLISDCFY